MDFNGTGAMGTFQKFIEVCSSVGGDGSMKYSAWAEGSYKSWGIPNRFAVLSGKCLVPVVLSDYPVSTVYRTPKKSGVMSVKLRFNQALAHNYTLFCFGIYSQNLFIRSDRSFILEEWIPNRYLTLYKKFVTSAKFVSEVFLALFLSVFQLLNHAIAVFY